MTDVSASRPVAGILWMLLTGFLFVAVTAIVKFMGSRVPAAEAAFLRYLFGIAFLLPLIRPLLRSRISGRFLRLSALRGAMHGIGVILWFYAMTRIPLAELTALNYLAPVYVTVGAVFVLGETLAFRRIAAVCLALVGAAVILRPGFRELSPGHWAMLLAAIVFAGSYLLAKILADEAPAELVVGALSVFVTITLAPFAFAVWIMPTWTEVGLLFIVAFFATAGHYTMTLAFREAPVMVTQPVTFLQLVWAVALGAIFFGEATDIWVILGGTLILGSVCFITWREATLKRRRITPTVPETKV